MTHEDILIAMLDFGYAPRPTEAPAWLHPLEIFDYWLWLHDD